MNELISIIFDGKIEHHIPSIETDDHYATLCSLVGECHGQSIAPTTKLTVDCPDCIRIWEQCKTLTKIKGKIRIKPIKRHLGDKPASIKAKTGWLLPNGKFYACNTMQHEALAEALGKPSIDIENIWIRFVHPCDSNLPAILIHPIDLLGLSKPPTKKQINFIWDWCMHHRMPYPKDELEMLEQ